MKKLENSPFALIGINVNGYDSKALKQAMVKENLTWRSFADPGTIGMGPIAVAWNLSTTPTYYLIDHKGTIRQKWVGAPGEMAIESAVERLLKAAERDARAAAR